MESSSESISETSESEESEPTEPGQVMSHTEMTRSAYL